jgi:NAD+ kinase
MSKKFSPKNIAIMYRPHTKDAIKSAKELAAWLQKRDYNVYCAPGQKLIGDCVEVTRKDLKVLDWVIVLGGDGTYLRAVRMLEGQQTPILGVNMGSLGFLTEIRIEDLYKAVEETLKGKMELRPRSMLQIEVRRKGKKRLSQSALNDVVIERGSYTHLINIEIKSQKQLVAEVKADALIISSPTGSTAYNLAAGGPICHPEVRALVVTPVCPHALTSRPLIFPDDQALAFRVLSDDRMAILTVDGISCGEITPDDEVSIVRSQMDHYVIRKPSSNYFSLLREKLKFGQRN